MAYPHARGGLFMLTLLSLIGPAAESAPFARIDRAAASREIDSAQRYAVEKFAGDLLDARDSLELGIAAAGAGAGSLTEGMQATLRLIDKAFERAGISVIDPQGEAFNPERHEAMATQDAPDLAPGTVATVVQKGYLLNGRVLRPARVLIARQPI